MKMVTYQVVSRIDFYINVRQTTVSLDKIFGKGCLPSSAGCEKLSLNHMPVFMIYPDGTESLLNQDSVETQLGYNKKNASKGLPKSLCAYQCLLADNPNIDIGLLEFMFRTFQLCLYKKYLMGEIIWQHIIKKIESEGTLKESIESHLFNGEKLMARHYVILLGDAMIGESSISKEVPKIREKISLQKNKNKTKKDGGEGKGEGEGEGDLNNLGTKEDPDERTAAQDKTCEEEGESSAQKIGNKDEQAKHNTVEETENISKPTKTKDKNHQTEKKQDSLEKREREKPEIMKSEDKETHPEDGYTQSPVSNENNVQAGNKTNVEKQNDARTEEDIKEGGAWPADTSKDDNAAEKDQVLTFKENENHNKEKSLPLNQKTDRKKKCDGISKAKKKEKREEIQLNFDI